MASGKPPNIKEWKPNPGPQSKLFRCPADLICYGGASFGGKGLLLDEPVWTPFGPRRNGDLRVGDRICNPDGGNATVTAVYDRGTQPIFRVTFADGESIRTDGDHRWYIWLASEDSKRERHVLVEPDYPPRWKNARVVDTRTLQALIESGRAPVIPLPRQSQFIYPAQFDCAGMALGRPVVDVREVGTGETRCLSVDHPNQLYIAGDSFVVTHNTTAAVVWAAEGYDRSEYRALILRRSFPELNRKIIPYAHTLFAGVGKWKQEAHTYEFVTPDNGRSTIEFGYCENLADVERYQGTEYTRIVFDESTRFEEKIVRNFQRFNRSSVRGIRRQMLLTTNPIGPGYGWHMLMFIKDRTPYKIYHDAVWPSDKIPTGLSTCFIPAKYSDNPAGLRNDPEYPKRLRTQEGPLAQALLEGRWDVVQDTALDFVNEIHTCDPVTLPDYTFRWMAIDWGRVDKACAVWGAATDSRVYIYRDFARPGKEIKPYAREIAEMCKDEHIAFAVLSHECFANRGASHTQADEFAEVFQHYDIPLVRSDQDAEGRLMLIREFLRTTPLDQNRPELDYHYWVDRLNREGAKAMDEYRQMLANSYDRDLPRMLMFTGNGGPDIGCPYLIQTLPLLTVDPAHPRKIARNQDDHGYDALGYLLKAHTGLAQLPPEIIYRANLARARVTVPDSPLAADLAMQHARETAEAFDPNNDLRPFFWPSSRYQG